MGCRRAGTASAIGDLIELNPKNSCEDDAKVGFVPMPLLGKSYLGQIAFEPKQWRDVKRGYTHFADGDVLLAKITPCFENGKAGIVEGLPNSIGAGSTEYFVCRPFSDALHPKYLLALFKTENFVSSGATQMTGSVGHKRVPRSYVTDTKIPLAPLPEQKRIADKLDTVLTRVDACRDRLNRVPLILKRFRQSVLAAATSGQLTADWREQQVGWADAGSPTSCDADASWASQAQPNLQTIGRSDEDRLTICGWKLVSLSKVCQSITDGDHQAPPQATSGIPFIAISAINDGQLRLEKASRYVPREYFDQLKSTRKPASGDVLFSVTGSICIPALVSDELEFTFQRHIAILRPNLNEITSKYLYFVLGSEHIKKQGLEVATGTAQLTVSLNGLRNFQIQLPPIAEQHEIVRRVDALFAFADRLEARLATARAATERLTPALLAKAFRGELVPQDPGDEPAAALLQRLAASRAEAGTKPRRAQKSRS